MENQEFKLGKVVLIELLPTVITTSDKNPKKKCYRKWAKYLCFCGKEFESRMDSVASGKTQSCGCYNKAINAKKNTKHGGAKRGKEDRLYKIYQGMKARCSNKNLLEYKYYGGKGITVCEEWKNDYTKFRDWALANGYEEHLTIDREDNDGNYEPGNCRWTDQLTQVLNRSRSKSYTNGYKGITKARKEDAWLARICVNYKSYHLGTFGNPEDAARAYNKAAIKYFGKDAKLNIIPE